MKKIVLFCLLWLSGCLGIPEGVSPVKNFELNNYLGKWYEIARLDHSFERGLSQVTAHYSASERGGVVVLNKGYLNSRDEWKQAQGKAYFVNDNSEGYLKVSFFGPFYGSYVVFELDQVGYQYAFVSGPNTNYLWLLARTPTIAADIKQKFVAMAQERGFNTDDVVWVEQN